MKPWVRWAAVVPSAIVAWYVAFVLSMLVLIAAMSVCPGDAEVSGMCTAPWYSSVERAITLGGIGLSAVFVVGAASIVAPSHRRLVAWVAFGVGSIVAVLMGRQLTEDAMSPVASALIAGLGAAAVISVLVKKA